MFLLLTLLCYCVSTTDVTVLLCFYSLRTGTLGGNTGGGMFGGKPGGLFGGGAQSTGGELSVCVILYSG